MPADRFLVRGWVDDESGPRQLDMELDPERGLIHSVSPSGKGPGSCGIDKVEYDDSLRLLPGDVNAHSHPEQSLYVDRVDPSWDLSTWCRNTIYRYSVELTPEHIYLGCCRAFAHMLLLGVTTAVVSFYCHNRRGNELDREVVRAARDTGIRLFFGRMHYDLVSTEAYPEKRASQESYFETIPEYETAFRELFMEVGSDPLVVVAPALTASTRTPLTRLPVGSAWVKALAGVYSFTSRKTGATCLFARRSTGCAPWKSWMTLSAESVSPVFPLSWPRTGSGPMTGKKT